VVWLASIYSRKEQNSFDNTLCGNEPVITDSSNAMNYGRAALEAAFVGFLIYKMVAKIIIKRRERRQYRDMT